LRELGLDLGLLVSQVVNFGLLLALLYLLLHKPVLAKLEERARRIKKGLEQADEAKKLLEEARARYDEEMARARRDAHDLIERATRAARQQREEILAQARQEAHELVLRAQEQARHELDEGQVSVRQYVVDLAIAASSRLLQENLDQDKHRRLIEEFLVEAGQLT